MSADKNNFIPATFRSLLLAFVFVMLLGGNARASAINECIDACFSGFGCSFKQDDNSAYNLCQSQRDRCVEQCNKNINGRDNEPPPVKGAYGAIAYDKTIGAWGMSDRSQDSKSAEASALKYCQKRGKDCEIVESISNTCAAVASGTGNRLGWAVADNPRQAGIDAIETCAKSGSSGNPNDHSRCFMQLYNCYSP